ncbi:DUF1819 family protein [Virgibacillus dakarensis]|nr:DUF1819 family protein [Virgibacillus dakarensis]
MNQQPYRSTIKSKPFLYSETRKLTELLTQGFSEADIRDQVINQNIFQVKTETRKKEIASTILKRLKTIDAFLLKKTVTADINTSKLIVLYAILKTDRLFRDFMNEVFQEKLAIQQPTLEDRDFNAFFEAKRQQSETVAKWKDYTFYKLQQVYVRILFEAGLLSKHNREIQIPLMNPDVLDHIRNADDQRFINAIVGEGGV